MHRIITLTTDFGAKDAYVAALKATILQIVADVRFVDISHEVAPQDVMEAAFTLQSVVGLFPAGTVHLVVIDPGVGTDRRPIAVRDADQIFVGPDNGIFALVIAETEQAQTVVLDNRAFWRVEHPTATFHGRDVFAPVAAHLASGRSLEEVGTAVEGMQTLHWALPISDDQGVRGWVVHVDRFGNCITNITAEAVDRVSRARAVKCYAGSSVLAGMRRTYADVAAGEPLFLEGSTGFLEVAVNRGNASELLGLRKGAPVNLVFAEPREALTS